MITFDRKSSASWIVRVFFCGFFLEKQIIKTLDLKIINIKFGGVSNRNFVNKSVSEHKLLEDTFK